jgi:hypothetical protein
MTKKLLWAIALVALVVATGAGAIAAAGENTDNAGNQIAGTWNVTVNRPAPLPPLASLQVFTSDGSWIEMANEPQASRTAQYGSWERIDGRHYAASGVIFRYDATGAHVATMKINRNMLLSPDGQTMTVAARATTYDLNGNVISSFPVRAAGERMKVDRIPDQP